MASSPTNPEPEYEAPPITVSNLGASKPTPKTHPVTLLCKRKKSAFCLAVRQSTKFLDVKKELYNVIDGLGDQAITLSCGPIPMSVREYEEETGKGWEKLKLAVWGGPPSKTEGNHWKEVDDKEKVEEYGLKDGGVVAFAWTETDEENFNVEVPMLR